jgi:hypothetical protein
MPYYRNTSTAPRRVYRTDAAPTEAQVSYIRALGGEHAVYNTRLEASEVIQRLKAQKLNNQNNMSPAFHQSVTEPAPSAPVRPLIMLPLLELVPNGYYALSLAGEPLTFLRLSRPVTGQHKGCVKVQTQHSEQLIQRLVIHPSGHLSFGYRRHFQGNDIVDVVNTLLVGYRAAAIRYGDEMHHCARCNKDLTDERSRWNAIGPECEKHWPAHLNYIADLRGTYEETH